MISADWIVRWGHTFVSLTASDLPAGHCFHTIENSSKTFFETIQTQRTHRAPIVLKCDPCPNADRAEDVQINVIARAGSWKPRS